MKFGDYEPRTSNARRNEYRFPNGYGASVINDGFGSDMGRFELAVLKDGSITRETPITGDVLGWLTADEVAETLARIEALP